MGYRIAYLTSKDPHDKRVSSGVYYYQSSVLKKYCGEVHFLGPVNNIFITIIRKGLNFLQRYIKKDYNHSHSVIISIIYGIIYSWKLRNKKFDFVFADKSSCEIAYLKTSIPVIYSTDATFQLLVGYYPKYLNLMKISVKEGNLIEQKAIDNSSLVICASRWAANSVVSHYNFHPGRVHVIPRGANIDRIPDRKMVADRKKTDVCRLLFMGADCYRKGYDIAYKTMDYIRSRNIKVKLTVTGCNPPEDLIDKDVEIISYIDKNTEQGRQLFDRIMLNSDFYLLPTRAECMGIAFCEAAAYGLPVITRNTGGVTEVVKDGINGYALDFDAGHREYGEKIISLFNSDRLYDRMIKTSRDYFEQKLNWDVWGYEMRSILDDFSQQDTGDEMLGTGKCSLKACHEAIN
jgi:glycosyltransferase involved in cell wall biosynthesis